MKLDLSEYIESFFNETVWYQNSEAIGYVPEDIVERMTDAAFNVLLAVKSMNQYIAENK